MGSREREDNMPFEKVEFEFPDPDKADSKSLTSENFNLDKTDKTDKTDSKKDPAVEDLSLIHI